MVGQTPQVATKMSVIKEVDEDDKMFSDEGKDTTAKKEAPESSA